MHNHKSIIQNAVIALTSLALVHCSQAQDTDYSRAGRWEFGIIGQYQMGDDVINNALGTGGVIGYNFNEHWNLNFEAYCGIRLETEVDGVDGKGSTYVGTLNLEYNFKPGKFSPFVSAGVGIFNYDAKESFSGDSAFSVAETGVSYGAGAGFRWEISHHWMAKFAYRAFGTTADGAEFLHGPAITIGWKF
jgi:opacity protein-like surface antigen